MRASGPSPVGVVVCAAVLGPCVVLALWARVEPGREPVAVAVGVAAAWVLARALVKLASVPARPTADAVWAVRPRRPWVPAAQLSVGLACLAAGTALGAAGLVAGCVLLAWSLARAWAERNDPLWSGYLTLEEGQVRAHFEGRSLALPLEGMQVFVRDDGTFLLRAADGGELLVPAATDASARYAVPGAERLLALVGSRVRLQRVSSFTAAPAAP